jgi:hypothetical protein
MAKIYAPSRSVCGRPISPGCWHDVPMASSLLLQGEIGPDLFRKACEFGLEGLVSKHRDRAYRSGTSPHWVKVKNPKHPALRRFKESFS